ncbi:MAG: endonuclease MutS2, partial [Clostridiales Family XIII bacterium]|nr:endonuclease MutS2 [Clostridiales Family XIII bacterium]
MIDGKRQHEVLEYTKVLCELAARTSSALAAEEVAALMPAVDLQTVKERLGETSEALSVIMRKGSLPLGDFGDISRAVSYAEKGGVLSMAQILGVARQLGAARNAVSFLRTGVPDIPILNGMLSMVSTDKTLEKQITDSILSETEMADTASQELRKIRRGIAAQHEGIREKLSKMIASPSYRDMLRDQLVTMRDGRFCLPVRQEYRQRVSGIVHDQSKGGATVFIEPQAVVNMNNRLRELELEEEREIERILAELSASVGAMASALQINQRVLTSLDLIFAKGKLSADMKAAEPEVNTEGILEIVAGRHPLIAPASVVPVSLSLGGDYRTLIITGPNTGGKTVTLKTVGLFILMTEAGLHVPVSRANIPIVAKIYADIGDEQSIEQSLSTFSSHMKNIVEIISEADRDSIVFLDELGAGTDPTEGAALAISILETLRSRGGLVMATTHYTEIKKYAVAAEGVENASMEFDIETLSPTYRLMIGIPGRSNAFEISRKLGLSEAIVGRAAELMDSGSVAFETVIARAEADRQAAEADRREAETLRAEIKEQKRAWDERVVDFEDKREKLLRQARDEAAEKIVEAEEYAAVIRGELKSLLDEAENLDRGDAYRKMDENRKLLRQLKANYRDTGADERIFTREGGADEPQICDIRIGTRVRLLNMDQKGEVLTTPDDRGDVQVRVGRIRMTTPISNLRPISDGGKKKTPKGSRYGQLVRAKMDHISDAVDVHGQNLDEAE